MSLFVRLSLFWKILLSTSIALTVLFAGAGWIIQDTAKRAISASLEDEVRSSFEAYQSLWRSRAELLASVSLVISRMSDVRAAFSTGDEATIRDSATELWSAVSPLNTFFLVAEPDGTVIASLGGNLEDRLKHDLPVVRQAASIFPKQATGFMTAGGRLYQIAVTPVYVQSSGGMGLLNVLVAGYAVDPEIARTLKRSTGGSDFSFMLNGRIVASTLPEEIGTTLQKSFRQRSEPTSVEAAGHPYIMLGTELLDVSGKPIGELRILRSFEAARQRINALQRRIVGMFAFSGLLGLALSYVLARRILKPVKELDRGALEVARGNYAYRVPASHAPGANRDELSRLAEAFNSMCASIQEGRRGLVRQERINTIARMSSSIVHDLRNPLASIYGGAEMLMDSELSPPQVQRLASNMYQSSRRMQELLQEFVDAGSGKVIGTEVCRLTDIVCAAVELYSTPASSQSVSMQVNVPDSIEISGQRARLERVFFNLIDNALAVMPNGGAIEISAVFESSRRGAGNGAGSDEDSGFVRVVVQDSGPGIDPRIRDDLFHPFVTAGKKNGIGLGLAFSHQTILDHGGELWADADCSQGARFVIRIPAPRSASKPAAEDNVLLLRWNGP